MVFNATFSFDSFMSVAMFYWNNSFQLLLQQQQYNCTSATVYSIESNNVFCIVCLGVCLYAIVCLSLDSHVVNQLQRHCFFCNIFYSFFFLSYLQLMTRWRDVFCGIFIVVVLSETFVDVRYCFTPFYIKKNFFLPLFLCCVLSFVFFFFIFSF